MTEQWIAREKRNRGRVIWYDVEHAEGPYRGNIAYVHPSSLANGITLDEAKANAELFAAAPALRAGLEKIAGEAPAKRPGDSPTVAWPPNWSEDMRDTVNDMIQEAFDQGRSAAYWHLGQIADAALARIVPVPPEPENTRPVYSDPIWHRDYRIYFADHGPHTYAFQHDDYDGADDACDNRTGYADTVDEAKAMIDEREDA